jgi:putative membrane protein
VKEFGQMMVTDHTKANEQLKKIAQAKSVDAPHALKPEHKAMKDQLSKLSGEAFDRAYIQHMVKDHQEDVAHFRKESTEASDPDVKQFASATLPTLQKHLKRAQEIEQIVNASR